MKKKSFLTQKDKKDWNTFTEAMNDISIKESDISEKVYKNNEIKKLDLHGLTLVQANRAVKKFIIQCFEEGYKNLLIITGKGIRSKVQNNPYLSEKMSVLKYSVPEFLKSDKELLNKIKDIKTAEIKDGGEGAFYIFLKQKKLQDKF